MSDAATAPPDIPQALRQNPHLPGCQFLSASWRSGEAHTRMTAVLVQRAGERDPVLARLIDHATGREKSVAPLHELAFTERQLRRLWVSLFAAPLALAFSVANPWLGLPVVAVIGVVWAYHAWAAVAMDQHLASICRALVAA